MSNGGEEIIMKRSTLAYIKIKIGERIDRHERFMLLIIRFPTYTISLLSNRANTRRTGMCISTLCTNLYLKQAFSLLRLGESTKNVTYLSRI